MKYTLLLCAISTIAASSAAEQTGDGTWSRFRGPNGTGTLDGAQLPSSWTDSDYAWKTPLPGLGHSSPVVWGSQLFVQSAEQDHSQQYLVCLSRDDGRILWQKKFPGAPYKIHARNSFATATPAVDDNHVYVAWSTAKETTLMALTHAGEIVWQRELGPYVSAHGFASSPVPVGDVVLLASLQSDEPNPEVTGEPAVGESFLAAFDCATGQQKWKSQRHSGKASYSVPAVYKAPNGTTQVICCNTLDGMFAVSLEDGKPLWSLEVFDKRTVSSPVIVGDKIFGSTGSGGGGNYLVAVDVSGEPREAYRVTDSAPYVPTSVTRDDLAFLWSDAGIITCLEIPTGKEVWRKRVGGNYSSSPVRLGDQLIGVAETGEVTLLAAGREYQLLGKNSLGAPSRATPALTEEAVYFRTESELLALPTIRK
jgi:hypothetical protein